MTYDLDVAIVGGSLAGSACAIELARRGIGASAFERRRRGESRVCGAFLSPGAVRALDRMGLVSEVLARGAVPIAAVRVRSGAAQIEIPFRALALGFSRRHLDALVAERAEVAFRCAVEHIEPSGGGYRVRFRAADGDVREITCRVVVDGAGRSSRFSQRNAVDRYGVQFESPGAADPILDFGFFEAGYGGSVSVEGGRRNSCFLIDKARVQEYADREGCLVTGSIGYVPRQSPYLRVGDAAGMIDPFSGEGMRHAIESGQLAARTVADGLAAGLSYPEIRMRYRFAWERQWGRKRRMAARLRWLTARESLFGAGLKLSGRFPALARTCLEEMWR